VLCDNHEKTNNQYLTSAQRDLLLCVLFYHVIYLGVYSFSLVGGSTAPAFIVRPRDVSVKKGSKAILYCAVTGLGASGNKPVLTWLRSGSTINIAEYVSHTT